ncbi:hypothetical protein KGP36_06535 [Patescibacteria group bacterium]|nr:hypothetical protein [Patescibacteria group bacterium]
MARTACKSDRQPKEDAVSEESVLEKIRQRIGEREAPIAYDENEAPDRFWKPDPCDEVVPKGFLSDLVFYTRGREVPTLYSVWTGLSAISTMIKREAWFKWADKKLFTNLYVILVGPAGIVKKGEALGIERDLVTGARSHIHDDQMKMMKELLLITDKTTLEGILEDMTPSQKRTKDFTLKDQMGKAIVSASGREAVYNRTAEALIMAPELGVMFSTEQYNRNFVQTMLALYDQNEYRWKTIKRGAPILLSSLHTNFVGATVPEGILENLPKGVVGDGFLSRATMVVQAGSARMFPEPRIVPGAPSINELRRRLAWIGENVLGEFTWEKKAWEFYEEWYYHHRCDLNDDPYYAGAKGRKDIHLIKLAMLIRASRYIPDGNTIRLEDVEDADRILTRTYFEMAPVLRMIRAGETFYDNKCQTVERVIKAHSPITRRELQQKWHVPVYDLNTALAYLLRTGMIRAKTNGSYNRFPSREGAETYEWVARRGKVAERTSSIEEDAGSKNHRGVPKGRKPTEVGAAPRYSKRKRSPRSQA